MIINYNAGSVMLELVFFQTRIDNQRWPQDRYLSLRVSVFLVVCNVLHAKISWLLLRGFRSFSPTSHQFRLVLVYSGERDYIAKLFLLCRRHLHTALCRCSRKVNVLEHRSITCQKLKSLETYYFVCLNICLNCIRFCSASVDILAITEALRNFLDHYNDDSAETEQL